MAQRPGPSPGPEVKGDRQGDARSAPRRTRKIAPDPIVLIQLAPIQKELELTAAQKAKIITTRDEFHRRRQEAMPSLSNGANGFDREALLSRIAGWRAEHLAALNRILEPDQRTRLEQIALQLEGPLALTRPEVARRINLNPEQCEQIEWIVGRMNALRDQFMQDQLTRYENSAGVDGRAPVARAKAGPPKGAGSYEKPIATVLERIEENSAAMETSAVREISRVLTRRQKAAFNKLLGEPFDPSALEPGRGNAAGPGAAGAGDAPVELTPIEPVNAPGVKNPLPKK